MCRHRYGAERLLPTFAEIGLVAHVGHIGDHLRDVGERGAVLLERALDLVESVFALRGEVALVEDIPGFAVLVLGADAGEEDHLARTHHGHRFGEAPLGPFAVIVVLLLEGLGRRCGR